MYVSRQPMSRFVEVFKEKKTEEWNRRRLFQTPCNWNFLKFISYKRFRAKGFLHHRNETTTPRMVCLQASNITTKRIKKRERFKANLLPYSRMANCNLQNVMSTNFAWFWKCFSWLLSVFAWQTKGANYALYRHVSKFREIMKIYMLFWNGESCLVGIFRGFKAFSFVVNKSRRILTKPPIILDNFFCV